MKTEKLGIDGAHLIHLDSHVDQRGFFTELFSVRSFLTSFSFHFDVQQINMSESVSGVIRGVHLAENPPGQSKYVICITGEIADFLVDLRPESPTFLKSIRVDLSSKSLKCIYIPSGVGHGFAAMTDARVIYLCDKLFDPEKEFGINPFDPELGIDWPKFESPIISDKDIAAPKLSEVRRRL